MRRARTSLRVAMLLRSLLKPTDLVLASDVWLRSNVD
jgi:hypothetical protein